jgi:hypothetical protein
MRRGPIKLGKFSSAVVTVGLASSAIRLPCRERAVFSEYQDTQKEMLGR